MLRLDPLDPLRQGGGRQHADGSAGQDQQAAKLCGFTLNRIQKFTNYWQRDEFRRQLGLQGAQPLHRKNSHDWLILPHYHKYLTLLQGLQLANTVLSSNLSAFTLRIQMGESRCCIVK